MRCNYATRCCSAVEPPVGRQRERTVTQLTPGKP
jgi:hypothetical protein